jgi:hypothetical protein
MLQKPDPGISATPYENNLRYFNVVIAGPQDSAYDGESWALVQCREGWKFWGKERISAQDIVPG